MPNFLKDGAPTWFDGAKPDTSKDRKRFPLSAFAAIAAVAALVLMVIKAQGARHTVSAVIYGLSMIAVYSVSAVYHGLKNGEAKRIARLVDHSTVPFLIAGTATPCALITLYDISRPHSILVLVLAWFCAVFGLISKIFFFERVNK